MCWAPKCCDGPSVEVSTAKACALRPNQPVWTGSFLVVSGSIQALVASRLIEHACACRAELCTSQLPACTLSFLPCTSACGFSSSSSASADPPVSFLVGVRTLRPEPIRQVRVRTRMVHSHPDAYADFDPHSAAARQFRRSELHRGRLTARLAAWSSVVIFALV